MACGRRLSGWAGGGIETADGKKWHSQCFTCRQCKGALPAGAPYVCEPGGWQPYHPQCYHEHFGPKCSVCLKQLPREVHQ